MVDRSTATVTLSQIAELTGYGASAVSNWRRRFDDFPPPVQTTPEGSRDLFSLAEVEAWLRAHDRLDPKSTNERLLFEAADLIRQRAAAGEGVEILAAAIALAEALERTSVDGRGRSVADLVHSIERDDPSFNAVFAPLERLEPSVAAQIVEIANRVESSDRAEMFEWVLGRRTRFVGTRTSPELIALFVRFASRAKSILDPAAGEGGILAAASEPTRGRLTLRGQEINEAAWRIAKQRFLLRGIDADLQLGDSLLHDAFPNLRVDAVLCDPPYGMTNPLSPMPDSRWSFGLAHAKSADYVWLQHAIHHLGEDGLGYVLLPAGSLFRRGHEGELRTEMIRRGAIDAVVSLPPGSAQHTGVALALWIVRRPRAAAEPPPVLVVDGAGVATPEARSTLDQELIHRIVQVVTQWRRTSEVDDDQREFAAAVPVLELLGADSNLVPSRWVQAEAVIDSQERDRKFAAATSRLNAAREALIARSAAFPRTSGSEAIAWVPVRELVAGDVAEIIRGIRIKPESCLSTGIRALRTRDIRDEILEDEPCYVDPEQMKPRPAVTQAGDIIVSPASGKLRALVDERGGHILAYPLQGLRLRKEWLPPDVAAAFLESSRNRRFVTGMSYGYARIELRDLELPLVPPEEVHWLRDVLEQVEATERNARELVASARDVREMMLHFPAHDG